MKLSDPGYGLLLTFSAIGSVLGTFLAEPAERLLGPLASAGADASSGSLLTVATPGFTDNPFIIGARPARSAASRSRSGT